jgi:SAM-dependent methyltransferase
MKYKAIGEGREQGEVTDFYHSLVYPSRVSDERYARLARIKTGEMIADFGCGQSLFYDRFRNHRPKPVFLDISDSCLRTIDYGFRVRGDIQHMPFADGTFDRIFCIGVIHHLPNPRAAIEETHRVLKRGGLFVMGVYSDRGFQPRFRCLYDKMGIMKGLGFRIGKRILTQYQRGRGNPLTKRDIELRARDWLETPVVRYMPEGYWSDLLEGCGFEISPDRQRISTMNIFTSRRKNASD